MAFSEEQQFQHDLEIVRQQYSSEAMLRSRRLEVLRIAKETLVENARNKPAEESTISAADITAFAEQLAAYIDA